MSFDISLMLITYEVRVRKGYQMEQLKTYLQLASKKTHSAFMLVILPTT